MESILTYCISTLYLSCTVADKKALQWVIYSAHRIIGIQLSALEAIYNTQYLRKASSNCEDSTPRASPQATAIRPTQQSLVNPQKQTEEQFLP